MSTRESPQRGATTVDRLVSAPAGLPGQRTPHSLGLAVTVTHRDPGGSVQISYRNLEQLDEVVRRLEKGR